MKLAEIWSITKLCETQRETTVIVCSLSGRVAYSSLDSAR